MNFTARAKALTAQMTVYEQMSQLRHNAPAIPRLGIPAYNWWSEGLHGVARAGTATVFPQAIGLAAMFDDDFLFTIADIIATEARAKYNASVSHGDRGLYKGITLWSPNINIFRDPRWGRGQETYGEDPYLTAQLGVAFVRGLQRPDASGYMKVAACAKHFAVHSGPEGLRHGFDAEVSQKDLYETYLPAFKALIDAGVEAIMGAYNSVNGMLCCGSAELLTTLLRQKWGFQGHVVSDCGAICDFRDFHKVTDSPLESAALALKSGCDLNCGQSYEKLCLAYEQGLISEDTVRTSAERVMATRLKLGQLDSDCEYDTIPYDVVSCPAHLDAARKAAEKSMVLLKNDGLLPLDAEKLTSIAVIGPTADSRAMLRGNYCGTMSQSVTILQGIQATLPNARVFYAEGCHLFRNNVEPLAETDDRISEALTASELADVVILCLGLDSTMEGEQGDANNADAAGDKEDLYLPLCQQRLMRAVLSLGKPTALLLSSGSAIDISEADAHPACKAILQTWYCGEQGGAAAARLLLGQISPSGRLPVTFYYGSDRLPDFSDYSMQNRTYRYMESEPLYPFGYGLSYAEIEYALLYIPWQVKDGEDVLIHVLVSNLSNIPCEEVTQVYVKLHGSAFSVKNHSLCGFLRHSLKPQEKKSLSFLVKSQSLMVINWEGDRCYDGDGYTFYIGSSQPDPVSVARLGRMPLCADVKRAKNQ